MGELGLGQAAAFQIALQQGLVPQGGGLLVELGRREGKIHAAAAELIPQLSQQGGLVRPGQVHFVEKDHRGDVVTLQQPPQGAGMGLNAVGAADHQDGAVQNLKGALGFGGEIHVARGVHQLQPGCAQGEPGLFGEDGDAPVTLDAVGIQKGIAVVHAAQLSKNAGAVEHGLGEGGFARIHVGDNADTKLFHCIKSLSSGRAAPG